MAQYELSENQVKQLIGILSETTIKGGQAPVILELAKALQTPVSPPVFDAPPELQEAVDKGEKRKPDDIK